MFETLRQGMLLKIIFNLMLALMLAMPMLEVAEASVSARISKRFSNDINKVKSKFKSILLPNEGEHSAVQKLVAGASIFFTVCTTSILTSCGGNKMIHKSEPLIAQFSSAELEAGDYVHVSIDGISHAALILGHEENGLQVEIFSEGFQNEGGVNQVITADKVVGKADLFHVDNGKQVLITGLELSKASLNAEDELRVKVSGFSKADTIYWHGIVTTTFTDGSMEVMISSKIYVHHLDGEHNQMITSLTEPVFTLIGRDKLAAPPYQ